MKRQLLVMATIVWCVVAGGALMSLPTGGAPALTTHAGNDGACPLAANPVPSLPQWADIEYSTMTIIRQSNPIARVDLVPGISILNASLLSNFFPATSTNATNINKTMLLHYVERFNITCTNANAESDFTINYHPSLVNGTILDSIRLFNEEFNVTFSSENDSQVDTFLSYSSLENYFSFNMSGAVETMEGEALYTGANYTVELSYNYPVQFTSWSMSTTHQSFAIEGHNATRVANYTQSFTIKSAIPLNISFYWFPLEVAQVNNPTFKLGTQQFDATFNETLGAYEINPFGVLVSTNMSRFTITFGVPFTVGFTNTHVNRWHRDLVKHGTSLRTRHYQLDILAGPEQYLLERLHFNITDIDGAVRAPGTYSSPSTTTSAANAQHSYVDEETGQTVTVQNGTRFTIGRMQKAVGTLEVGLDYSGSYNATLRILDEVRNPMPGADVTLFYHGERYGVRMASEGAILNPPLMSDDLGYVYFYQLPEGNYSVLVEHLGFSHEHHFRVSKDQASISIEVVTPVPYRADMLVGWTLAFSAVAVIAFLLVKKKK